MIKFLFRVYQMLRFLSDRGLVGSCVRNVPKNIRPTSTLALKFIRLQAKIWCFVSWKQIKRHEFIFASSKSWKRMNSLIFEAKKPARALKATFTSSFSLKNRTYWYILSHYVYQLVKVALNALSGFFVSKMSFWWPLFSLIEKFSWTFFGSEKHVECVI